MSAFRKIPFFQGLDPVKAEGFERGCVFKRYEESELVLDFDDRSTDVYFIVSGAVRVLVRTPAGREMILGDLRSGQFFGEMAAVDGSGRSANVTAVSKAELFIMPASLFRAIIFSCPEICERL